MKEIIKIHVRYKVDMSVTDHVWGKVWIHDNVYDRVFYHFWDKVLRQIRDQVVDQVWKRVKLQIMKNKIGSDD